MTFFQFKDKLISMLIFKTTYKFLKQKSKVSHKNKKKNLKHLLRNFDYA